MQKKKKKGEKMGLTNFKNEYLIQKLPVLIPIFLIG